MVARVRIRLGDISLRLRVSSAFALVEAGLGEIGLRVRDGVDKPSIELICSEFAKIIPRTNNIKIGAYDMHHVFIDFDNKEDHFEVISRNCMSFGRENIMVVQKWSSKFKPNAGRSSFAPVWITLPKLPWHYYEWDALCRILEPVGILLIMDKATTSKTRPITTKVRVEINLTKPLVEEVLLEIINDEGSKNIVVQKIEYESIPAFCTHCKMRGHFDVTCRISHPELKKEVWRKENKHKNIVVSNKTTEEINHQGTSKRCEDHQMTRENTNVSSIEMSNSVSNQHVVPEELMKEAVDEEGWKIVVSKKGKGNTNLRTKDTEAGDPRPICTQ
nr:uncharacterized protein LOC108947774 [Nicotiana tomentosiformis]